MDFIVCSNVPDSRVQEISFPQRPFMGLLSKMLYYMKQGGNTTSLRELKLYIKPVFHIKTVSKIVISILSLFKEFIIGVRHS